MGYLDLQELRSCATVLQCQFLPNHSASGFLTGPAEHTGPRVATVAAIRHPAVVLQMVVFFLYTGLEVAISQWTFTVLTESREVNAGPAGIAVGAYWGASEREG